MSQSTIIYKTHIIQSNRVILINLTYIKKGDGVWGHPNLEILML